MHTLQKNQARIVQKRLFYCENPFLEQFMVTYQKSHLGNPLLAFQTVTSSWNINKTTEKEKTPCLRVKTHPRLVVSHNLQVVREAGLCGELQMQILSIACV